MTDICFKRDLARTSALVNVHLSVYLHTLKLLLTYRRRTYLGPEFSKICYSLELDVMFVRKDEVVSDGNCSEIDCAKVIQRWLIIWRWLSGCVGFGARSPSAVQFKTWMTNMWKFLKWIFERNKMLRHESCAIFKWLSFPYSSTPLPGVLYLDDLSDWILKKERNMVIPVSISARSVCGMTKRENFSSRDEIPALTL